jgi:hypothetical protein
MTISENQQSATFFNCSLCGGKQLFVLTAFQILKKNGLGR